MSVGWTWSALAKVAALPIAAVPSMIGVVVEASGTAAATTPVVATRIELSPGVGVVDCGVPVTSGDASGAAADAGHVCKLQRDDVPIVLLKVATPGGSEPIAVST